MSTQGKQIWINDNIHESEIWSLGLTADNKLAASSDADGKVQLWQLQQQTLTPIDLKLYHKDVHKMTFLGNELLATGDKHGLLKIWNVKDGRIIHETNLSYHITALSYSQVSKTIGCGLSNGTVQLLKIE